MRIAIVGAGALGSLFAALLARLAKAEVWLVGAASSQAHLEAIAEKGLEVQLAPAVTSAFAASFKDTFRFVSNLHLTTHPDEVYPADLALVLVKSYRTFEAARQVRTLLAPGGLALSLQNGLGNLAKLVATPGLEPEQVVQGVTSLAASLPGPGVVRWNGVGPVSLGLSSALNLNRRRLLLELAALLSSTGLTVKLSENIEGLVWGKLIINCAINPLGALLNLPNGALVERPAACEVLDAAAQEAANVAQALGIALPYPYEEAVVQARQVARFTASNINSMLDDVRRGRPTEIEAINGAVVGEGQRSGIATPVNWTLTRLVEALSQQ